MDEFNELFSEIEAIHGETDKCIKKLEAENKRKDEYIKKLKKIIESLEVEKDLTEKRNEYLNSQKAELNRRLEVTWDAYLVCIDERRKFIH